MKAVFVTHSLIRIEVTVLNALNLTNADSVGRMEPYVEVSIGKEKNVTKSSLGSNPEWNETIVLNYGMEEILV